MTARQYQKIYHWFTARPAAHKVLTLLTKGLPLVVAGGYALMVLLLAAGWLRAVRSDPERMCNAAFWQLVRCTVVPAAVFLAGSVLRGVIDAPRPYEQAGFVPLVKKTTKGRSFPSRHSLSAGAIAVVGWAVHPAAGAVFTAAALGVCVTRVLAGAHHIRDVAAGVLLGALGCAAGMLLL